MRAVVFEGERRVGVHDVPDPTLFDARSAIVEVEQTSICGSDLHFHWGEFGDFSGVRPGHEFIGRVATVGPDVTHIAASCSRSAVTTCSRSSSTRRADDD